MASLIFSTNPDSKVHGTNMGPIWDRQDPGGPGVYCVEGPSEIYTQSAEVRLAMSGGQPLFT